MRRPLSGRPHSAMCRMPGAACKSAAAVAESLSPYAVLARGYALPEQNGTPCAVETLRPGEAVTLRGARAAAECRVEAVHTLEQKTGE